MEVWSSHYDQVESTCLLAESVGVDGFYYGESPNDLDLDCWTTLGGLARATERLRLGPVITNVLPTYRSLVLLAKQAATVHAMSNGRVDFRTGVGASVASARPWWEPHGVDYPAYDDRIADLATAMRDLPTHWGRGREASPPPITIAARGRRAMGLAAAHAAVWETSFCTPEEFARQGAVMDDLLEGRQIVRSLEIDGFVAPTSNEVGKLLDRVRRERGGREDLGPVLERALIGDPATAADQLAELGRVGVEQVVIALHDPHDRDGIETVGEIAGRLSASPER